MLGTDRPAVWALAFGLVATLGGPALGDDPPAQAKGKSVAIPSEVDLPVEFVPAHPRTTQDRDRIEAARLFATARALEKQERLDEAIGLLEQALKKSPDDVAILRRLSLLNLAEGKVDQGVAYSRRVLESDPTDTETLGRLLSYYLRQKEDAAAAQTLLKKVLSHPRLTKNSPAWLIVQRDLGDLFDDLLNQPKRAADAYAAILDGLGDQTVNRLSPSELRQVLRDGEAESYRRFAVALLKVNRAELAALACRRGLAYDPDHPQLPRLLAEALVKAGKSEEALAVLEPFLKRQPIDLEPYELLGEILTSLKRSDEILPRLEAAAKADSKNLGLQLALADRYRRSGQVEKADALLKDLLKSGDPRAYAALITALRKQKKAEELIPVLDEALKRQGGFEAVKEQISLIADDPAFAGQLLDAALTLQKQDPMKLGDRVRKALALVAGRAKKADQLLALDEADLKQAATPENYSKLLFDQFEHGKYAESAKTIEEFLGKFPDLRNVRSLDMLSRARFFAGKMPESLDAAREAEKLDPNDLPVMELIGFILGRLGKNEEAIAHYKDMLRRLGNEEEVFKKAHEGLSAIYVGMDDFAKGESELETVYEKYPDDPGVNNDLGYLYADQGKNLEKAEAMIRKAIEEAPENSAYLDSLGWVLYKRGRVLEALEPLDKAAKATTADATIFDHLGDVHLKLKNYDKARSSWKQAQDYATRANPPDKRLPEIRKKLARLEALGGAPKPETGEKP